MQLMLSLLPRLYASSVSFLAAFSASCTPPHFPSTPPQGTLAVPSNPPINGNKAFNVAGKNR